MKPLILLLIVFSCLSCTSLKAQQIEVKWKNHQLVYNDHVGNEWGYGLEVDGTKHPISTPLNLNCSGKRKIRVFVQEIDKYTEEVSHWIEINHEFLVPGKIYTKDIEFVIQENMGRYAGNLAKWVVTIQYRKISERA